MSQAAAPASTLKAPPQILADAISAKDMQSVQRILKNPNFNINGRYPAGYTALQLAAANSKGDLSVIAQLINAKAEVSLTNDKGETALFFCVGTNRGVEYLPTVRYLLEQKADPNHKRADGWSSLGLAAFAGNFESVGALLEHKGDPDQTIANGATPTWLAAQENHAEVIQKLALAKADLDRPDNENVSPLWKASKAGKEKAVECLLQLKVNPNGDGLLAAPPLSMAVSGGFVEATKFLLAAKAELNDLPLAVNPLLLACKIENGPIIRLLLNHQADPSPVMKVPGLPLYSTNLLRTHKPGTPFDTLDTLQPHQSKSSMRRAKEKKKNAEMETSVSSLMPDDDSAGEEAPTLGPQTILETSASQVLSISPEASSRSISPEKASEERLEMFELQPKNFYEELINDQSEQVPTFPDDFLREQAIVFELVEKSKELLLIKPEEKDLKAHRKTLLRQIGALDFNAKSSDLKSATSSHYGSLAKLCNDIKKELEDKVKTLPRANLSQSLQLSGLQSSLFSGAKAQSSVSDSQTRDVSPKGAPKPSF